MKVVVLHPPLYPIDHKFFNLLGKYVDLTVYNFGEYPRLHQGWKSVNFVNEKNSYKIKFFGKGAISLKTQLNPSMLWHLAKDKPDVVISVAFWIPSLYASLVKKILGFKFLIKTDAITATDKSISRSRYRIRKIICKNTDAFISASDLTSEYLKILCPKVPIELSLQTIDIEEWLNNIDTLPNKNILRKELNIPQDKTILLGVGGLTEKKNWMAVFRQMKHLDDCYFVLVGAGKEEKNYRDYIEEHNLDNVIKLISRKEGIELVKYFKMADIFIFPSLYDQFGYVVPEALASGLPVICTEKSGASSLIKDGLNGYIVDPHQDFYNEIKLVITNLKSFQENALLSIGKYSLSNKVEEYLNILGKMK